MPPSKYCSTDTGIEPVELTVTYTDPAVKGDTSTNALKEATLETGAMIMVPLLIHNDELISVNTTDRSYGGPVVK